MVTVVKKGNMKMEDNSIANGVEETHNLMAESFMEGTVDDKIEQSNNRKRGDALDEK
jgi:hypothetical protein